MYDMPKVYIDKAELTTAEMAIAQKIINGNSLRASKPTIHYTINMPTDARPYKHRTWNILDGSAAYLWRMVAFQISPRAQHQCLPVMADFDLPIDNHEERRAWAKRLDLVADKIVNTVPKSEWYGIRRWGNALGSC